MGAPRIIWRYIFVDMLLHVLLGLAVVTLVLVVQNTLRFLEEMVGAGVGLDAMVRLIGAIVPSYFVYAVPTALVFGVLLTFGRMSLDGEIAAFRASGISIRRLFPPVLAIGLGGSVMTAYLLAVAEPRSYFAMKTMVRQLGKAVHLIEPEEFQHIDQAVVYVQGRGDSTCPLRGVLIGEFRNPARPFYVTALCATTSDDGEEGRLGFLLTDGSIHLTQEDSERYRRIRFATMELSVDVSGAFSRRKPRFFTTAELLDRKGRMDRGEETELRGSDPYRGLLLELHRRAALPLAPLLLVLIAVPLGIRPLRAGRSAGALTAVGVVALYWLAHSVGEMAAEEGYVPVAVGMWAPNALALALALFLMRRTTRIEA